MNGTPSVRGTKGNRWQRRSGWRLAAGGAVVLMFLAALIALRLGCGNAVAWFEQLAWWRNLSPSGRYLLEGTVLGVVGLFGLLQGLKRHDRESSIWRVRLLVGGVGCALAGGALLLRAFGML